MEQESSVIQWLSRELTPFWHGDDEDSLSSPCHNGVEEDPEFGNDAQEEVSQLYIQATWIIVIIFLY